jgi:hypothetical protein
MNAHRFSRQTDRKTRKQLAHIVVEFVRRLTEGRNIQPGLNKETAEKQDAQDDDDGDYDDLNQAHNEFLKVMTKSAYKGPEQAAF